MAGAASGETLHLVATILWSLVGLGVAAAVGRWPNSTAAGISAGIVAGMVIGFVPPFLIGFLGMTMPLGQMEFWSAALWRQFFGG